MKRIYCTAAALLIALSVIPTQGKAQGKGRGGGNDKGPPPTAGIQRGGGQGNNQPKPVPPPRPQTNQGIGRGVQMERTGNAHVANPGNAHAGNPGNAHVANPGNGVGRDIAGGVRGMERRSPVANAVANGPKIGVTGRAVTPAFLKSSDVRRFNRDISLGQVSPEFRNFAGSNRASEAVVGGALAYAMARGLSPDALLLYPSTDGVQLRNRAGKNLLFLDDDEARSLGAWQVAPLADDAAAGAPSFCRSGAGHPVWGRQWCIDKGFGLGTEGNLRWGSTRNLSDLVFNGDLASSSLTTNALLNLLGPVAFNRLALHALTLGLTDPLTGTLRSDPSGQRLLLVSSGPRQIAEMVDLNNDKRADQMLVALRPW
jgi:hypothetical protein